MFWPKSLIYKLKAGKLSEKAKFIYLLLGTIITITANYIAIFAGYYSILFLIIKLCYSLLITIIGFIILYSINAKADNKLFIERYIIVLFPLNLINFIISFLLFAVWYFGYYSFNSASFNMALGLINTLWGFASGVIILIFLILSFKYIHKK